MVKISVVATLALLALASCVHVDRQPAQSATDLRQKFFNRDYFTGYKDGQVAVRQYPADDSIAAWFIANAARSGHPDEALEVANARVARDPSSGWAQFSKAAALLFVKERAAERIDAGAAAYALDPKRADFIWVYSESLRLQQRFDEANAMLAKHRALVEKSAQVLVSRGSIAFDQYLADKTKLDLREAALADFSAAQKLEPSSTNAYFAHAWFLGADQRNDEAFEVWQKAVAVGGTLILRQQYWWAALERAKGSPEESRNLVRADVEALLKSHPNDPEALNAAAHANDMLGDFAAAEKLHEQVLALKIPGKPLEEAKTRSLMARSAQLAPKNDPTAPLTDDERRLENEIVDFVSAPDASRESSLNLSQVLYRYVDRSPMPSKRTVDVLLSILNQYGDETPYLAYSSLPSRMADKGIDLEDAERLVLKGKASLESKIAKAEEESGMQFWNEPLNMANETLGWIWFKQGKLDEAERQLAMAAKNPPDIGPVVYPHIATLYLERGEPETAMLYLERCFAAQWSAYDLCTAGLTAYYRKQKRDAAGEEKWVASKAAELKGGKTAALAEKYQKSAKKLLPFSLTTLDGEKVNSADLRGKVLVISFWGAWCGACMIELPELQQFVSKYQHDDGVVVLTINNDENPERARNAAKEKGLTAPIVIDAGYAKSTGVYAYPTTWVIGPEQEGRLEVRGTTPGLVQRLDDMLAAVRSR